MSNESFDASRGTALWAFNQFKQDALTQLLQDLVEVEETGISEEVCLKVQNSLKQIANAASAIPDGSFFSRAIWVDIDAFRDSYRKWNDVKGESTESIQERDKMLRQLRNKRHRIACKTRKHQHVLSTELDLEVVTSMYGAFSQLVTAVPELFANLAKAINRFNNKK
ncbi:hypothetical protein [Gimesia sp.]|uniref:hypothetical protein n=1 Tax=Gimesia sp. TaxID=2024833 RepID=UPI003A8E7EE1